MLFQLETVFSSSRLKKYVWVLGFLALSAFHFQSLNSFPSEDETVDADRAAHGFQSLWVQVLPPSQHYLLNLYPFGIMPTHIKILRASFKIFGVSPFAARLPSWFAGSLALGLLFYFVRRLKLPSLCWIAPVLYGVGWSFSSAIGSSRSETILMFLFVSTIIWIYLSGGRALGALLGMASGFAVSIHPAVTFLLAACFLTFLIRKGKTFFSFPPLWWWAVGMGAGLLGALFVFDPENAAQYVSLTGASGRTVSPPPLAAWKWDLPEIFFNAFRLLNGYQYRFVHPFQKLALGGMLSALAWQIRRYKFLAEQEKFLAVTCAGVLLFYGLMTSTLHRGYHVYLYPWMFLLFFLVLHKLAFSRLSLDSFDVFIFSCVNLACLFSAELKRWEILFVLPLVLYLFEASIRSRVLFYAAAVYLFLLVQCNWDIVSLAFFSFLPLKRLSPALFCVGLLSPFLLFKKSEQGIRFRPYGALKMNVIFLVYLVALMGVYFFNDVALNFSKKDPARSLPWDSLAAHIRSHKRVLAPGPLWFEDRTLQLQDLRAVTLPSYYWLPFDEIRTIQEYNPDLLLCESGTIRNWSKLLEQKKLKARIVQTWNSPVGPLNEVEIISK